MKKTLKILLLAIFVVTLIVCLVSCDAIFNIIDAFDDADNDDDYEKEEYDNCAGEGFDSDKHAWDVIYMEEPTCNEYGYKEVVCKNCGLRNTETLEMLSHDIAVEEGYPAKCNEYGRTDRTYCTRCNMTVSGGEILDFSGEHNFVKLEAVPHTCTEDGLTEGEACADCGMITISQMPDWASHSFVAVPGYPATCTSNGLTDGEVCEVCGEVTIEQIIIPGGHNYIDVSGYAATCTEDGLTDGRQCTICSAWEVEQTVIKAKHEPVTVPGTPATCLSAGVTEGSVCSVCETVLVEQEPIAKIKHTPTILNGYAATCCTNGLTDGISCSVCSKPLATQHTIFATGHSFGEDGKCIGCTLEATPELIYNEIYDSSVFAALSTNETVIGYSVAGLAYGSTATEIVIPDVYNGLPVIEIEENAFAGNTNITKVTVTSSIKNVGANAFDGCTALSTVVCEDFAQSDEWANGWYGDSYQISMSAPVNGGKTPYDVYVEAMMTTNHGIDRYKVTTHQYSYEISDGIETLDTETIVKQYQYLRDCYAYNSVRDYANNQYQETEVYYVNSYLYQKSNFSDGYNTYSYAKVPYSYECWLGEMTINRTDIPEFTEEYFKSVEFVKSLDGTMYLKLEMDGDLMLKAIASILKDQFDDMPAEILAIMQITNLVYEYEFDSNGNLTKYSSDSTLMMNVGIPDAYGTLHYKGMRTKSVSNFSEVGTYSGVSAPTYYYDATAQYQNLCPDGRHYNEVEVEGVEPNCYADGVTDFSYCKRCYEAINTLEIIPAEHNYEYNECTECGHFQWGSTDMEYELNEDETGYILVGIGNCKDTDIVVPHQIYGLPVLTIDADAFDGTDVELIFVNGHCYTASTFEGIEDTTDLWK